MKDVTSTSVVRLASRQSGSTKSSVFGAETTKMLPLSSSASGEAICRAITEGHDLDTFSTSSAASTSSHNTVNSVVHSQKPYSRKRCAADLSGGGSEFGASRTQSDAAQRTKLTSPATTTPDNSPDGLE